MERHVAQGLGEGAKILGTLGVLGGSLYGVTMTAASVEAIEEAEEQGLHVDVEGIEDASHEALFDSLGIIGAGLVLFASGAALQWFSRKKDECR
ncbi:MAG: hypothetical protein ACJKTH_00470 [Patescibacteria group bacterium UBA2163]